MKRIICMLIAASLCLSLIACAADSAESGGDQTESIDTSTTEAPSGRDAVSDGLPEKNYEGRKFNFFCRTANLKEFKVDGEVGEVVNDAVYTRNRTVEERFNVVINTIDMDGTWANMANYKNNIAKSIMSGDGAYDLVEGDTAIVDLLGNNYFVNLLDLPYIDTSKPWWARASVETMNIGGVLEFVSGDLSLSLWEGLCVVFFNKKLVADYSIDNPYELVRTNNWTIDTVQRISRDIYRDIDGDGEVGKGDLYGMITTNGNMIDNYFVSSGVKITRNDQDGFPKLGDILEPRAADAAAKVFEFMTASKGVFVWGEEDTATVHDVMFMDNQGVFYNAMLKMANSFRAMETDFGILPYPKYEASQERFTTFSKTGFSAFAIPATAPDTEFASIILEALCAESYKKVIPAYYEIALKGKYSRDNDSAEMLDIIRDGFDYDFACVALDYTNWILLSLRNIVTKKNFTWTSDIEKAESGITKNLDKLKETIITNRK